MARRVRTQEENRRQYQQRVAKAKREGYSSPSAATRARKKLGIGPRLPARAASPKQAKRNARAQAAGFPNDYQMRKYVARAINNRPSSSDARLTPAQWRAAKAAGFTTTEIATIHRAIFSHASVISISNRPGENWIRHPLVKIWYVDILGKYTDAEFDSRYGLSAAA